MKEPQARRSSWLIAILILLGLGVVPHQAFPAEKLVGIYAALSDTTREEVCRRFAGRQFSDFKGELADLAVAVLRPLNEEMKRLLADPGHIDALLRDGAERARALAAPVIARVHEIVGFLKP